MNSELIREIADQIVRQEILKNWMLYAILIGLGLVSTVIGNWLSTYLKRRAETYATKADLQEILRQLQVTTRATEEVKAAISHADWISREWRTTRRAKLEEIVTSAHELDRWLDSQKSKWIYQEPETFTGTPLGKITVISTLYFPELKSEILQLQKCHQNAQALILDIASKRSAVKNDAVGHKALMNEYVERWRTVYPPIQLALNDLENQAAKLMREIAGIQ
jgi:hypothetical protein